MKRDDKPKISMGSGLNMIVPIFWYGNYGAWILGRSYRPLEGDPRSKPIIIWNRSPGSRVESRGVNSGFLQYGGSAHFLQKITICRCTTPECLGGKTQKMNCYNTNRIFHGFPEKNVERKNTVSGHCIKVLLEATFSNQRDTILFRLIAGTESESEGSKVPLSCYMEQRCYVKPRV